MVGWSRDHVARSIFIGSAPTLRSAHRGIERQRIWRGLRAPRCPGTSWATSGRPWTCSDNARPTCMPTRIVGGSTSRRLVTRTAADYADTLRDRPEEIWIEIRERLRRRTRRAGSFSAVIPGSESTAEIRDVDEAQLVILHPSTTSRSRCRGFCCAHLRPRRLRTPGDGATGSSKPHRVPRRGQQADGRAHRIGPSLSRLAVDRGSESGARPEPGPGHPGRGERRPTTTRTSTRGSDRPTSGRSFRCRTTRPVRRR